MGGNSNKEKSRQLGVPWGTAAGRLRKLVLFHLLKRHGENNCFRCGGLIESAAELSIEHKEPWLHTENPVELFFDMANIAFSHLRCNSSTRRPESIVRSASGYKGVRFQSDRGRKDRWSATGCLGGKNCHIGRFATARAAAMAYDEFVTAEFGDKAVTNHSLGLL